ncbi:PREDICTED: cadherin-related tumor suppressor-like [Poecilia mexicana]|uniref:cadherin-related tumor suppressor-like n=1 Tax=Poecilia mexicana TaxID=48701 RepID=UPI00072E5010|nr:PREDICTED: cadherin-related tumor suppressor-like [Poecilia mexicana]
MDGAGLSRICVGLIVSVWIHVVTGSPIGSTTITCGSASTTVNLGPVDEGYTGDVELVSGIPVGTIVTLEPDLSPEHLEFLEMISTPGGTTATVRTKKPLDADVLTVTDRVLHYALVCDNSRNFRRLIITDVNDNSPVFDKKFYSQNISENHVVNTEVLQVRAVDADSTPEFNLFTYSYTPVTPDFSLSNSGAFMLIRRLNYNVVPKYNFIVTATDNGGNNDTTSVEIVVQDFDNLNPFFSHSLYQAVVPENQMATSGSSVHRLRPATHTADETIGQHNKRITPQTVCTTTINCGSGSEAIYLGPVDEGYSGDVELVSSIPVGSIVSLESDLFPEHLQFLELNFTSGETTATVRTKKPLDAEVNIFFRSRNFRRLIITDVNDNSPVFDKKFYSQNISENHVVNTEVLQVRAVDADSTPEFNLFTYSYTPVTPDFSLSNSGAFMLIRRLNYNVVPKYNFIVTATDNGGNNDTTSVEIVVQDFDNLNPFFSHSLYQAVVPENQDGDLSEIRPEPIKAQDGDTGINMTITYSITSVSPSDYQANFNIDADTGVLTVVTSFDREEMDSSEISVNIKAAQTDDPLKTADAVVSVTVEDVNDNAPEFDQSSYNVFLLKNSFTNTVTDLDQIITTIRVSITDDDNKPEFSSSSYETSILVKDAEKGKLLLTLRATDKDIGNNSLITYSFSEGHSPYLALDSETGEVTLTYDLADVTEDFTLVLTAEATDHGKPPLNATVDSHLLKYVTLM